MSVDQIDGLLVVAGWSPDRSVEVAGLREDSADLHAFKTLQEFSGLSIGEVGEGQECAASDVQFFSEPRYVVEEYARPWLGSVGRLVAVGDAHNSHMLLYVGQAGEYYVFTEPNEELYWAGGNIREALKKLLLGLSLDPRLPRDDDRE